MEEVVERIRGRLANELVCFEMRKPSRAWARVDKQHMRQVAATLRELGGRLATMTGLEVRDGIEVNYHFCFDHDNLVLTVKALAPWPEPSIDSLGQDIPGALWIEREINDLLGLEFDNHPDMRRLILPDDWPEGAYPLRKGFRR